jgi:hypothetical protein
MMAAGAGKKLASVKVRGAKETARALRDFAGSIDRVTEEGMKELAPLALDYANSLTPVRTGYLRSRNRVKVDGKVMTLSNDAPYARAVHDGNSRRMPQPFVSPVKEELRRVAPEIICRGLAEALQRAKDRNQAQ